MSRPALNHDAVYAKQDPVDYCLDCWRKYMHRDEDELGGKVSSRHFNSGESDYYSQNYERNYEEQDERDYQIGEATDACVDSLKLVHNWAVYKTYGITTVFRFHSADLLTAMQGARIELEALLRKNICTRLVF